MNDNVTRILWLDLETTGLNPQDDVILEVGAVLTNRLLEVKASFARWIRHDNHDELLETMPPVVLEMHKKNGLLDDIAGDKAVSFNQARQDLKSFFDRFDVEKNRVALAGQGVAHFDINFLKVHMPEIAEMFHHGLIDISHLRRFTAYAVSPRLAYHNEVKPVRPHRALDDARAALSSAQGWAQRLAKLAA